MLCVTFQKSDDVGLSVLTEAIARIYEEAAWSVNHDGSHCQDLEAAWSVNLDGSHCQDLEAALSVNLDGSHCQDLEAAWSVNL